ncbi:hypothetical protein KI387_017602 [Taxus chinensis]|uniref:Uncharacterized protein n=1 Tax=Taxus chinensis TaxID=29808 RepID=A0AA38GJU9_TAXCH|nr:hypothetical protein KI387_017602 [Taxus chinensis]
MERSNSVIGRPKTKENNEIPGHMCKLCRFQSPKGVENSEEVDEFTEEDVWDVIDTVTEHVNFHENEARNIACVQRGYSGAEQ